MYMYKMFRLLPSISEYVPGELLLTSSICSTAHQIVGAPLVKTGKTLPSPCWRHQPLWCHDTKYAELRGIRLRMALMLGGANVVEIWPLNLGPLECCYFTEVGGCQLLFHKFFHLATFSILRKISLVFVRKMDKLGRSVKSAMLRLVI